VLHFKFISAVSISDDEIWNVLAFIRSRWSKEVRERHAELDAQVQRQRKQK
jgi:mono/diheme cytochrome c family protein